MNILSSLLNFIGGQISDYQTTKSDYQTTKGKVGTITVTKQSVSSLPVTITNSKIRADHKPKLNYLSNPSAMTDDWKITCTAGQMVIAADDGVTGQAISGTTDIEIGLEVETDTIVG